MAIGLASDIWAQHLLCYSLAAWIAVPSAAGFAGNGVCQCCLKVLLSGRAEKSKQNTASSPGLAFYLCLSPII